MLRRMVLEEKTKLRTETLEQGKDDVEKVSADEVEPGEEAGALEKDIDHLKVLKVHEARLRSKLRKVSTVQKKIRTRVMKKI